MPYELVKFIKDNEVISSEEMLKRYKDLKASGAQEDLDWFLSNEIPKEWREFYTVFPEVRRPGNSEHVAYVCWCGDRWVQDWGWLDYYWVDRGRLLRRKSSDTLKQLLKSLKLSYVNPDITEENFPIQPIRENLEVIQFDKIMEYKEIIEEMNKQGVEPANLYELLSYVKKHKENWLVALGSEWQDSDGYVRVPVFSYYGDKPDVGLGWQSYEFHSSYRFLVSRNFNTSEPKHLCPNCKKELFIEIK